MFLFLVLLTDGDAATHDDDGAGDGDGSHAPVGDGVSLVRVADAGVIAVDPPLVRTEHQRQDGRGQSRWRNKRDGCQSSGSQRRLHWTGHSESHSESM